MNTGPHPLKLENRVNTLRAQVEALEQVLPQQMARVAGEDEEWNRLRDRIISKICTQIQSFKVQDEPSKAVAILSRLYSDCERLLAPQAHIDQHRVLKKNLDIALVEYRNREEAIARAHRLEDDDKWMRGRKRSA